MWTRRRLLKESWTEMKSDIPKCIKSSRGKKDFVKHITKERSEKMFGHQLRHNPIMTNIFKGRINGHKGRGRPRKAYLEEIIEQTDCN